MFADLLDDVIASVADDQAAVDAAVLFGNLTVAASRPRAIWATARASSE